MSRKPKDLTVYHGHHVIDGEHLRSQFEAERDERERQRSKWRKIRHGVMLTLLLLLVVGGSTGAWAVLTGRIVLSPQAASPAPTMGCPAGPFDYAAPQSVHVNVLNATGQDGLARSIADQLAQRKFVVGKVANSTADGAPPALIVSGAAGEGAAFTVQRTVPGSVYTADGRGDSSVDLILLPGFAGLKDPGLVDQTPGGLVCAGASPSPAPPAPPAP
ncbi:LytR C-terminal domain-containing protein [Sinomonas humi]|uniref:LytR C-terminal domain-containing protein n=1 Tax=Sinomonas humi TaxID=1338436 RepID=UPI00068EA542|nr:LytR C-terminal domain-containing protein [Sinomonas humi]